MVWKEALPPQLRTQCKKLLTCLASLDARCLPLEWSPPHCSSPDPSFHRLHPFDRNPQTSGCSADSGRPETEISEEEEPKIGWLRYKRVGKDYSWSGVLEKLERSWLGRLGTTSYWCGVRDGNLVMQRTRGLPPNRTIQLRHYQLHPLPEQSGYFRFQLLAPGKKTLHFITKNQKDYKGWMNALGNALSKESTYENGSQKLTHYDIDDHYDTIDYDRMGEESRSASWSLYRWVALFHRNQIVLKLVQDDLVVRRKHNHLAPSQYGSDLYEDIDGDTTRQGSYLSMNPPTDERWRLGALHKMAELARKLLMVKEKSKGKDADADETQSTWSSLAGDIQEDVYEEEYDRTYSGMVYEEMQSPHKGCQSGKDFSESVYDDILDCNDFYEIPTEADSSSEIEKNQSSMRHSNLSLPFKKRPFTSGNDLSVVFRSRSTEEVKIFPASENCHKERKFYSLLRIKNKLDASFGGGSLKKRSLLHETFVKFSSRANLLFTSKRNSLKPDLPPKPKKESDCLTPAIPPKTHKLSSIPLPTRRVQGRSHFYIPKPSLDDNDEHNGSDEGKKTSSLSSLQQDDIYDDNIYSTIDDVHQQEELEESSASFFIAMFPCVATDVSQLSFHRGDRIKVVPRHAPEGWVWGHLRGSVGLVAVDFLVPEEKSIIKLARTRDSTC